MVIKKITAQVLVLICACLTVFSQTYTTRYEERSVLRINPLSSESDKNHVLIDSAEYKTPLASKNGVFYDKVSYRIYPQQDSSATVYYKEEDSLLDSGGIELFITEDSMWKVKIPELSWYGQTKDEDSNAYKYINRDSGSVNDGLYILSINLLRYNNDEKGDRVTESVVDLKEIYIQIDTMPPKIAYDILWAADDSLTYSYYLVPKEKFAENFDYMAWNWEVLVNGEKVCKFVPEFAISLPCIRLNNVKHGDKITITAIDDLGNLSSQSDTILSKLEVKQSSGGTYIIPDNSFVSEKTNTEVQDVEKGIVSTEVTNLYAEENKTISENTISQTVSENKNSSEVKIEKKKIVTRIGKDGKERLDIDDIIFPASGIGFLEDEELAEENLRIIKMINEIIEDNIEDIERVEILGYANPMYYSADNNQRERENEEVLIPLSRKRAEYVKKIMMLQGLPEDLLVVIPCGGSVPETNPKDKSNRYKNRRVCVNVVKK